MDALELIHPVRLRIVYAFAGARALTATQLQERLTDVPKATLYRHIAILADAGVLEVVDEQRVRGAMERIYRLRGERPRVSEGDAARMSSDDHRRTFNAAIAATLAEFNAYLERPDADPIADGVGYKQFTIWLTPDEVKALAGEVGASIAARAGNEPAPGRSPYFLTPIFFPLASPLEPGGAGPKPPETSDS